MTFTLSMTSLPNLLEAQEWHLPLSSEDRDPCVLAARTKTCPLYRETKAEVSHSLVSESRWFGCEVPF